MLTIKRYPNRKLYNTQEKCYITLDEIGDIIRSGEEVRVLDHASGEEITSLILTQIIMEKEKKQSGSFPHSILAGLVRSGEDTLNSLQTTLLGSFRLTGSVDAEIRRRIDHLVGEKKIEMQEAARMTELLCGADSAAEVTADKTLSRVLKARGIPSRDDVVRLSQELDQITKALDAYTARRNSD